jgi:acetyltransferase-like isoleucine patch superfamily enzyme
MKNTFLNSSSIPFSLENYDDDGYADPILSYYSLGMFGIPIITRNINILKSRFQIKKIAIPQKLEFLSSLIDPSIKVEPLGYVYHKGNRVKEIDSGPEKVFILNEKSCNSKLTDDCNLIITLSSNKVLSLPCNTIVGNDSTSRKLKLYQYNYPWEFLEAIWELLRKEIKKPIISKKASIAKTSIIEGPCIIEDNVVIDDFAKIKGPVYIGNGSFIGMGSLIRNSMLNPNTSIGFNCEIGKTYFAGNTKISHHNVILDSVIGKNVWFGGYSGTANVLLTRKNILYKIKGKLLDTGRDHFGAVVSNNCSIGASVIILPGRKVPPDSIIPAGTIFEK